MARIRSVKPELWSSPGIETLEYQWRLLFIAMWQWADDYGRGTAEPRELMGFAFPRDENITLEDFRRGLGGIHRVFGVKFYQVSGRPYYSISTWEKHQKIDKRAKRSKHPAPEDGTPFDPTKPLFRQVPAEDSEGYIEDSGESAEVSGKLGVGTGEQGNSKRALSGSCSNGPFERDRASGEPSRKRAEYPVGFEMFWAAYPRRTGKRKALEAWRRAKGRGGEQAVLDGAKRLASDPNLPERQFIPHPATWLNRDGWEDEPLPVRNAGEQQKPRRLRGTRPEDWGPMPGRQTVVSPPAQGALTWPSNPRYPKEITSA
ncbi:hypothetical protein H7347_07340 [Corynebacterium sp. zg-331]|uniref:hypothetical protein n=1 Tax=unclassified Corynebacterium TaxID=2624378 RepID=UPI00128D3C4A|nr:MULTISPECIES: hypothetical protein [unclassified Corynebacterium]MBC3186387.1 hypothetical protein [Corynebacterium sp. zg-331]MPV52874.1 hypothetical protein [Corynebacterium sp. zg331]